MGKEKFSVRPFTTSMCSGTNLLVAPERVHEAPRWQTHVSYITQRLCIGSNDLPLVFTFGTSYEHGRAA